MKVTYSHEFPPYWEVTAGDGRWWSVAYRSERNSRGIYTITNAHGRTLDPQGPTGRKLIDTVHNHMRGT